MNDLIAECIEVKESIGYTHNDQLKHWKNTVDWEHVLEEFADCLHFLLAAWMDVQQEIVVDRVLSDDELADHIFEYYKAKVEENHARQERGY